MIKSLHCRDFIFGYVAEWTNAPDCKSGCLKSAHVGSNPTISSIVLTLPSSNGQDTSLSMMGCQVQFPLGVPIYIEVRSTELSFI